MNIFERFFTPEPSEDVKSILQSIETSSSSSQMKGLIAEIVLGDFSKRESISAYDLVKMLEDFPRAEDFEIAGMGLVRRVSEDGASGPTQSKANEYENSLKELIRLVYKKDVPSLNKKTPATVGGYKAPTKTQGATVTADPFKNREPVRRPAHQETAPTQPQVGKFVKISSFTELYDAIRKSGGIRGSKGFQTPDNLIDAVEAVRNGRDSLDTLTRSEGLRVKVSELLRVPGYNRTDSTKVNIPEAAPHRSLTGFKEVGSFTELYDAIRKSGGIRGSKGFQTPDNLIDAVEAVRQGRERSDILTRTNGLRDKVSELLRR